MLKALTLNAEQRETYGSILELLEDDARYQMQERDFTAYCKERAAETCKEFRYDSYGFDAVIDLEKPEMVFFSVPYEKGWTAQVNGKDVTVERVNVGFMAVLCEAGENTITFSYETPGLRVGAIVMLCGAAGLVLYLILMAILDKGNVPKYPKQKHYYDYAGLESFTEHQRYLAFAEWKQHASPRRRKRPRESMPQPPAALPENEPAYDEPAYDEHAYDERAYDGHAYDEPAYPDPFADEASAGAGTEEENDYDA